MNSLLVLMLSIFSASDVPLATCTATGPLLEVVDRRIPIRYVSELRSVEIAEFKRGGYIVFQVETDARGNATKVSVVCSTVGPHVLHTAKSALSSWRFKVTAPSNGQVEVSLPAQPA